MTREVLHALQSMPGDEDPIDGYSVMHQWGMVWPRVVARAWEIENSGQTQDAWYENLVSGNPRKVRRSLEESGFASEWKNGEWKPDGRFDYFWKNTKIVVKHLSDGLQLTDIDGARTAIQPIPKEKLSKQKYNYDDSKLHVENGWCDTRRLENTVVLTLPPKPAKIGVQAAALADYIAKGKVYPFTCCV